MPKLSIKMPSNDELAKDDISLGTIRPSLLLMVPPIIDAFLNTSIIVIFNKWFPEWSLFLFGILPGFLRNIFVSPSSIQAIVITVFLVMIYLPLIIRGWRLWCITYEVRSRSILSRSGIFNRLHEQVEMADVRDIAVSKPIYLRIFKYGNLVVYTADRSNSLVHMKGIRHPLALQAHLRELCNLERLRTTGACQLNE